jgi:hypothetical protein
MNDKFENRLSLAFTKTRAKAKPSGPEAPQKPIDFLESAVKIASSQKPKQITNDRLSLRLNAVLEELSGMATPTDDQPSELFIKFARALRVLGTKLGIGPLQDVLKSRGIKWKKSDDRSTIIIYVDNAETGAAQPITRITPEDLNKPGDFEDKLLDMLDFAKGEAPGSFKQKQELIRKQEQVARDIAKAAVPQSSPDQDVPQLMAATPETMAPTIAANPK